MPQSVVARFVPQALTGSRILLGAAALVAVSHGDLHLAATLITLGAVTDGLDGAAARWLGGGTLFGIWFDYFSDYVCYIAAAWALSRSLLGEPGYIAEAALAVPLITAAIRYARNGVRLAVSAPEVPPLPGLGTVFFTFVPVTVVFLGVHPPQYRWGAAVFLLMILAFSVLMNAPVRFPKLTRLKGASPAVLILLAVQPFWMTRTIAGATLVIGLAYVLVGVFLGAARSTRAPDGESASRASRTRPAM